MLKCRSSHLTIFHIPSRMKKSIEKEIQRYLRNGEHDGSFLGWPGQNFLACAQHGHAALLGALISTVRKRTTHVAVPRAFADMDVVAFTRTKVAPMVRGLFPRHEQETVIEVLGRSVVFLTPANIDTVLGEMRYPGTAWNLANLYLASCGTELLSKHAPRIVGLSEETTCYVSADYFREESRFDDFVVHEAAHIFHNCKRRTIGLREIRGREWLLEIDFVKRETFAYACEAYSRILAVGGGPSVRKNLLSEREKGLKLSEDRVDVDEYLEILRDAVAARNGWKRILERCSASRPTPRRGPQAA